MEDFMRNVTVFDHPLIKHKTTHMCDVRTGSKEYSELVKELATLMGYEALKDLPVKDVHIQAPLAEFDSPVLAEDFTLLSLRFLACAPAGEPGDRLGSKAKAGRRGD